MKKGLIGLCILGIFLCPAFYARAIAATTKLTCIYPGGGDFRQIIEIDVNNRVAYWGRERIPYKITGKTDDYITMSAMSVDEGGHLAVLDLTTGVLKQVRIGMFEFLDADGKATGAPTLDAGPIANSNCSRSLLE